LRVLGAVKVFIALPAFGQTNCSATTFSLMATAKALLNSGVDYYFSDYSFPDIGESRNLLTTIWHDRTDADWMLQIDADMKWGPALITDMLAFNQPLTGIVTPKKRYPIEWAATFRDGEPNIDRGFLEVDAIGFGITLIHRSCVQTMLESGEAKSDERVSTHGAAQMLAAYGIKRIIRAFDGIETETGKLSEDLSFCRRHKNCGGKVWAATHHEITHMGLHPFTGRFSDLMQARHEAQAVQVRPEDRGEQLQGTPRSAPGP
jgi:hypothetical protein